MASILSDVVVWETARGVFSSSRREVVCFRFEFGDADAEQRIKINAKVSLWERVIEPTNQRRRHFWRFQVRQRFVSFPGPTQ